MKKRYLLLILLPLIALTSCGQLETHSIGELQDIVFTYSTQNYTSYSYVGGGYYFGDDISFEGTVTIEANATLVSALTEAPLQLTTTEFYYETSRGVISSACQYYTIYERLVNASGSLTEVQTHIDDDNSITFYSTNSDNTIRFWSLYSLAVNVNARWNVELKYDSNGYLLEESYTTINYKEGNTQSCSISATYTYE